MTSLIDAFNNSATFGTKGNKRTLSKRVIIFSRKGNTGRSFHADKTFLNKQKRIHYLLDGGFSAYNAIQGFGRDHRANQLYPPEYVLVTTDIPGEIRFISAIVRRLGQLGALSAGDRKRNTQGIYSEKDNLYSKLARDAMSIIISRKESDRSITLLINCIAQSSLLTNMATFTPPGLTGNMTTMAISFEAATK